MKLRRGLVRVYGSSAKFILADGDTRDGRTTLCGLQYFEALLVIALDWITASKR